MIDENFRVYHRDRNIEIEQWPSRRNWSCHRNPRTIEDRGIVARASPTRGGAPSRAVAAPRTPCPPAIAIPRKELAMHLRTPLRCRFGLVVLLILPGLTAPARRPAQGRGSAGQPPGPGDEPVPAPARPQPRGLVSLGPRGVCQGQGREEADLPVDRLQLVLLVPRHGARELRGRRDRQGPSTPSSSASRSIARSGPTSTRSTWSALQALTGAAAGRCRCS